MKALDGTKFLLRDVVRIDEDFHLQPVYDGPYTGPIKLVGYASQYYEGKVTLKDGRVLYINPPTRAACRLLAKQLDSMLPMSKESRKKARKAVKSLARKYRAGALYKPGETPPRAKR